jgi:hypothetical protein
MTCTKPSTTSLSLGSTTAIMYTLCALAFAIFPGAISWFVNSIAHGVNLKALEIGAVPFTFGDYFVGLISLTAYTMITGYVYGAIKNGLQRQDTKEAASLGRTPAKACH